jgi:spermidine synthase
MRSKDNLGIAIFLLSFGVLIFELTLTRLFSVLMWYHFASLSIAAALLGFALGGVLVHLRPTLVPERDFPSNLVPWTILFGLSAAVPFLILGIARLKPDILFPLLSFFHQPYFQPFRQVPPGPDLAAVLSMVVLYTVITLPFLAAGIVLAGLFLRLSNGRIGSIYAADLAGAAAGCVIFVPGLQVLGAPSLLLVAGVAAFGAAALLSKKPGRYISLGLVLVTAALALYNGPGDRLVRLQYARGQYEPDIRYSAWNALSRVVVYPLSRWEAEQAWGISRRYTGDHPGNMGMLVDDAGYTPIVENRDQDPKPDWAPWHIISLASHLRPAADTLVIGPGGGRDILAALGTGARQVTAIELNPLIVKAADKEFRSYSGAPYSLPGVKVIVGEGRSELARLGKRFDIIQASSVFGEISPAAGAFSLSANFLYTREAFTEYWDHLTDDGILSLTRSVFGLRALRMVSLARDLLVLKGDVEGSAGPEESIAVIRERGLATVLVSRAGFTPTEIEALQRLAVQKGFTVEYLPGAVTEGRFGDVVRGVDVTDGRFDISPPTDDRPFFYNNVPKSRFFNVFFKASERGERHIIVLRTMAAFLALPLLALLLLPVFKRKGLRIQQGLPVWRASIYFAAIGLGYIIVELVMMHRLTLFLGNPAYSLTVVLAALLLFSAAGSFWAGKRGKNIKPMLSRLQVALFLLIIGIWIVAGALSPSLKLSTGWRVLITALIMAPPGFVMGIFLPVGLSYLSRNGRSLVPWAWAVNGAASVAGSLGSIVIAMNFGYSRALLLGVLCYALTFPLIRSMGREVEDARKEVDL